MQTIFQLIPAFLVQLTLALMAIFIILLVLVQRGRGGGLAGALGGPGGSSAFGAKAGDTFTRITIVAVSIWIVTCILASLWASNRGDAFGSSDASLAGGDAVLVDDAEAGAGAVEAEVTEDSAAEAGPLLGAPAGDEAGATGEPATE